MGSKEMPEKSTESSEQTAQPELKKEGCAAAESLALSSL